MSNLSHFISENVYLCLAFIAVFITYVIFELRQAIASKFNIDAQTAINLTNRDKGIFIDVREANIYKESHIVGAINIPYETIKTNTKSLHKHKNTPIVLYCNANTQSTQAYRHLIKEEFEHVFTLKGGFKHWQMEKLPIDKKTSAQPKITTSK